MAKDDVVMRLDANTASFVENVRKAMEKMQQVGETAEKAGPKVDKLNTVILKLQKLFSDMDPKSVGADLVQAMDLPRTPAEALTTALGAVKSVLAEIHAEAGRAAENLKKLDEPAKSLIQTSATLGEFKQSRQTARNLASRYGMSPEQAMRLMVSVKNRGMEGSEETFAQTSAYITSPDKMVDAVADIRESFGDKAGDPRQVMNKLLFGAAKSKLDLENFSPEAVKAAPLVSQMGGTSDELIAMMGVGAGVFGKGEKAADRINRGASELQKMGFGGKGGFLKSWDAYTQASAESKLASAEIEKIETRQTEIDQRKLAIDQDASKRAGGARTRAMDKEYDALTLESRALNQRKDQFDKKVLKETQSSEFSEFKQFMTSKRSEIEAVLKGTQDAGAAAVGADLHKRKIDMTNADSEEGKKLRLRQTESALETAEATTFGEKRLETDAAINRVRTRSINRGDNALSRIVGGKAAEAAQMLGLEGGGVEVVGESALIQSKQLAAGAVAPTVAVVELLRRLVSSSDDQTKAIEEQNKILQNRSNTVLENNSEGQK